MSIGEAKNPGTGHNGRALSWPFYISESQDILDLNADVICLSETFATIATQRFFVKDLIKKTPHQVFWGCPVDVR